MIKGLTDRDVAFPQIGIIRKGAAKPTEGRPRPGRDLEYFRVVFDEQEHKSEQEFRNVYGDKPQEINILLPFDEIPRVWDAFYEAYTAGRMVAQADGERYLYLGDIATGAVTVHEGEPFTPFTKNDVVSTLKNGQPIKLVPTGRLRVVIRELARFAYFTVKTGSYTDIGNISEQLLAIKSINRGKLAGVPLVLRRRPKKISTPQADGSRKRYTKWMLSIEADPQWVREMMQHFNTKALPGGDVKILTETVPQGAPDAGQAVAVDGKATLAGEHIPVEHPDTEIIDPDDEFGGLTEGEWANNFETPKGARLEDLSVDELQLIIDKIDQMEAGNDPTGEYYKLRRAAGVIIDMEIAEARGLEDELNDSFMQHDIL